MIVWRLENADGWGPYQSYGDAEVRLTDSHNRDRKGHPGPVRDFGLRRWMEFSGESEFEIALQMGAPRNIEFGNVSNAQLHEWFRGFLTDLKGDGYRVHVYDVPTDDVITSRHQAAFRTDHARRLTATECLAQQRKESDGS